MKRRTTLAALTLVALIAGCTTQNWYEGVQENQRQQCRQHYPDVQAQQQCVDKVNGTTYQQYQQERQDSGQH